MNKRTTIRDITKKANVSVATVSRVLRRTDYPISQGVEKRVFDAADELEYKPNLFGRMLRGDTSIEIGIIVPSINNPFYAAQVAALEEEYLSHNFIPIVYNSNSNPGLESWYLEMLEGRQATGILLTTIQDEETFVKRIGRLNMPVLLMDQGIENYTGDRMLFNFFKTGYMTAEYLIECGHKDLALASGPITKHNRREILRDFKQALLDYDIVFNRRRIVNYDSKHDIYNIGDDQGVIQIIDKIFEEEYLPESIVAINDSLAIKMINELHNRGTHVPNDISIIGMDGIFVSKMVTPRLTTIHEPAEEMGKRPVKYLIDKAEGKSRNIVNVTMQPTLVERNSVRKAYSRIGRQGEMAVYILDNSEELGGKAVELIAQKLNKAIEKKGKARVILSTGASQFEIIKYLVEKNADWEKVTMFHSDEYLELPETYKTSFRRYLKERSTSRVPVKMHFVNTEGDVERNLKELTSKTRKDIIDIGVIGIGENGHIAFNDPPADLETREAYRIVELEERCKKQQLNEGWFPTLDDVPFRAVSTTPYQIMQCETIVSNVSGEGKAEAVRNILKSDEVTNMVPATLLKIHKDWHLSLDKESSSLIDN